MWQNKKIEHWQSAKHLYNDDEAFHTDHLPSKFKAATTKELHPIVTTFFTDAHMTKEMAVAAKTRELDRVKLELGAKKD